MYEGRSILALIPARGGSKGIPFKNIKKLGDKPLIAWTIEAAKKSRYIDRMILSSDNEDIMATAKDWGCEVPFVRPAELAKDTSGSMEVILHALDAMGREYDYLLLLQPTSPFRTTEQIDGIIEEGVGRGWDLVISVKALKKHPMYYFKVENGFLESFLPSVQQLRRQDMPPAFEHNGALYLSTTRFLRERKSYNVPEARPYIMTGPGNIDIDDPSDWDYAEHIIGSRHLG